jgi:hypothetical protein
MTRGTRSQIPENLGHVPEFDTIGEFCSRGNDAIYEFFRLEKGSGDLKNVVDRRRVSMINDLVY